MIDKLILDSSALAEMGFAEEAVYLIEYDLHSEKVIPERYYTVDGKGERILNETGKGLQKRNKLAREFRNKLIFLLKYNVKATKHLESCWIISENRLESTIKGLESLKEEMKAKNFPDVDKRLRVIPIITTLDGFQHYEDKKAEFLLQYAIEHIKYMEKAEKARRCASGLIWRSKKAYEAIAELSGELKRHKRYKELLDTNIALDEVTNRVDSIIKLEKAKIAEKMGKKTKGA